MRSIAIINQKGGVGKTTTAVNLSAALARAGQRVGLIDIDPQAHASLHLGLDPQARVPTVYDLLTEDTQIADLWQRAAAAPTPEENLWVAASHIDLAAAEVELAGVVGREVILRDKLAEAASEFDYILIDCPPSLGILTINALAAVDDVFLPLQPHFLALHGLSKLLKTIGLVNNRLNDRLPLAGVVLCLYESGTKLAAEVSKDVEQFFRRCAPGQRHGRLPGQVVRRAVRRETSLPVEVLRWVVSGAEEPHWRLRPGQRRAEQDVVRRRAEMPPDLDLHRGQRLHQLLRRDRPTALAQPPGQRQQRRLLLRRDRRQREHAPQGLEVVLSGVVEAVARCRRPRSRARRGRRSTSSQHATTSGSGVDVGEHRGQVAADAQRPAGSAGTRPGAGRRRAVRATAAAAPGTAPPPPARPGCRATRRRR